MQSKLTVMKHESILLRAEGINAGAKVYQGEERCYKKPGNTIAPSIC